MEWTLGGSAGGRRRKWTEPRCSTASWTPKCTRPKMCGCNSQQRESTIKNVYSKQFVLFNWKKFSISRFMDGVESWRTVSKAQSEVKRIGRARQHLPRNRMWQLWNAFALSLDLFACDGFIRFGMSWCGHFKNYTRTHTHNHYSRPLWFLHSICARGKVFKMKITLCSTLMPSGRTCCALRLATAKRTHSDTNNAENDNKWTENLERC